VSKSAHTPLQLTSSLPQPDAVHTPETHDAVSPHALPQSPQLFESFVTSTHLPAQVFFGARHGSSLGASTGVVSVATSPVLVSPVVDESGVSSVGSDAVAQPTRANKPINDAKEKDFDIRGPLWAKAGAASLVRIRRRRPAERDVDRKFFSDAAPSPWAICAKA
jgi:hypothetical protein